MRIHTYDTKKTLDRTVRKGKDVDYDEFWLFSYYINSSCHWVYNPVFGKEALESGFQKRFQVNLLEWKRIREVIIFRRNNSTVAQTYL